MKPNQRYYMSETAYSVAEQFQGIQKFIDALNLSYINRYKTG